MSVNQDQRAAAPSLSELLRGHTKETISNEQIISKIAKLSAKRVQRLGGGPDIQEIAAIITKGMIANSDNYTAAIRKSADAAFEIVKRKTVGCQNDDKDICFNWDDLRSADSMERRAIIL